MQIRISDNTMAIIRTAAKANNAEELEALMRYGLLRDTLRLIVADRDRDRVRAAKRKEARRWPEQTALPQPIPPEPKPLEQSGVVDTEEDQREETYVNEQNRLYAERLRREEEAEQADIDEFDDEADEADDNSFQGPNPSDEDEAA